MGDKEARQRYYAKLRTGYRPIATRERIVAQAIADGANSIRDVMEVTGMKLTAAHNTVLNLRGHGIVLPPPDANVAGGLAIAPGYVVHRNEIYQLMKVGIR